MSTNYHQFHSLNNISLDEKITGISGTAKKMLSNLKNWFPVSNPAFPTFDPLYAAATLLNPPYRLPLDDLQLFASKKFILELMRESSTQ